MSTYFRALMRASGLAAADARPETARHAMDSSGLDPAVEAGAIARETIPETVSQPTDRSFAPPAAPPMANVSRAAEFTTSPTQIPPKDAAPTGHSQASNGRDAGDRPRDERPSEAASIPSEHATQEAELLAALRWVRADPQLAGTEETRDLNVRAIEVEGAAPAGAEASPPTTQTIAHEKPPTIAHATHAYPTSPVTQGRSPTFDRMPAHAQEVIEVSIGAIHVRVDAPPPSARVAPSASTLRPKARSDAVHKPPRSGLARRALRRI